MTHRSKKVAMSGNIVASSGFSSTRIKQVLTGSDAVVLFTCFSCGKSVLSVDAYVEVSHFNGGGYSLRHIQFHEECFSEIAGDDYVAPKGK